MLFKTRVTLPIGRPVNSSVINQASTQPKESWGEKKCALPDEKTPP